METIIGDWKVVAMLTSNENGEIIWGDFAHFEAQDDDEMLRMFGVVTRFTAEGKCLQLMDLPEGFTAEMVAEEEMEMLDGKVIIESHDWKEENGKLWLDSGETREAFGEPISSFDEIKLEGEMLVLPSIKLERI